MKVSINITVAGLRLQTLPLATFDILPPTPGPLLK